VTHHAEASRTRTSARRRRLLAAAGGAATLAAFGGPAIRTANAQSTKITVATAFRLANYMPLWTAIRRGVAAKQGLEIELLPTGSIAEPVAMLNAGKAQIAITGTGMSVNATVEGSRIKVISRYAGAIGLWVITRPGSTMRTLADLKGKSIATLRFPSNTVSSPTYLMKSKGGFDPAAAGVKFVEGPPGSTLPAVRDGRVDCGIVFEWDASIAESQGLEVAFGLGEQLGPIAFTAAMVKDESLKSAADLIQRFVNVTAEGMRLTHTQPGLYAEVAAAEFPQVPADAVKKGSERLLGLAGFVPRNPVMSALEWDAMLAHETSAGTIRKPLSFAEMVDNSFAERATAQFGLRS
jgi:NitT/TauT family transport system substrate-binding protein